MTLHPSTLARNSSPGYKVDISRGQRIGRVSSEWFSRPDDERYLSLSDLHDAVRARVDTATARTVETRAIRVVAAADEPERLSLLLPDREAPVAPTHWSFGQMCSLVGAPSGYLRQLPAALAGINMQHGLLAHRGELVKTLETGDGRTELRAVTGPDYGRIWDHELVAAVMKIAGNGTGDTRWKVPGLRTDGSSSKPRGRNFWPRYTDPASRSPPARSCPFRGRGLRRSHDGLGAGRESRGGLSWRSIMTKQAKITLSGAREIPFNALVLSQANVRRVKAGVSIDSLAADIARRGLLQSLTVRAQRDEEGKETGHFEVPAGGRRFRALQMLVKQRRLAKTEPVPCIVRDDDAVSAEEDSLAENVHREPLHPLDQFRSMQKLVEQGSDVETIAATFMVTPAVVKQRLKLAEVSPKLHDIYAEDGMTLEQLMAFSVSSDHARQEQVWDMLASSHTQQPWYIRARLTEDKVRASDKRVLFVTLDAYREAGGHILRDLFESDDGGWLEDVALLDRLQAEKLEAEVAGIAAEGWKWVETAADFPYGHTFGHRPIDGVAAETSAEDEARIEALREEADRLEDEWAGAEDIPDEISARIEAIDEEIAPLVSKPLIYDPEEMAIAGTFVSIDVDGSLHIERGFVRPEDEPQAPAEDGASEGEGAAGDAIDDDVQGAGTSETAAEEVGTGEAEDPDDLVRPLPDKLVTDLTAHRTLALRNALAASPLVAFAAMLHAIVLECFYTYASSASCVGIALRNHSMGGYDAGLNDTASARAIRERHEGWSARLPDATAELWDTLASLDADDQAALFAHCVSFGVNAVWEPATRYNEGRVSARAVASRIEHSHILARASGLDMVQAGWVATTANYLGRVTKPGILDAVEEACGAEAAGRIAGLKKPEMASAAEELLKGTGWLAHPLRTPVIDEPEGDAELDAANDDGPASEAGQDEVDGDDIDAIAAE